jgi:hypothetical protein
VKIIEKTYTSFNDTQRICKAATEAGEPVGCYIFHRLIVAQPGDDPHVLYRISFPELFCPPKSK